MTTVRAHHPHRRTRAALLVLLVALAGILLAAPMQVATSALP
jgi:hypothetical protein